MKPIETKKVETQCIYDLAIIGGGPAGLAAAIYGSADGLKTVLVDAKAPGGQCGRSSCVENYLGFPDGISGEELADRAVAQARKFGCKFAIPATVNKVTRLNSNFVLSLTNGQSLIFAKAIVVASGLKLRKLGITNEEQCKANIHYYAPMAQGRKFAGKSIHIIGGANSAAQAALYFSSQGAEVTLLVRGKNLSDSMSQYLEDRLRSRPNVRLAFGAQVTSIHGKARCEKLDIVIQSGHVVAHTTESTAALLVYAGATPDTPFLEEIAPATDSNGYIKTGNDLIGQTYTLFTGENRVAFGLESSVPGLFVAGDVRYNSPKGVTAGVGEGATAVKQIHSYLSLL